MNIEEIMKPYFNKKEEFSKRKQDFEASHDYVINIWKEEIEKYKLENQEHEKEMLALKTRLQTLRNNKVSEIEEYVKSAVSERPDFYAGYGAMIRKDLEQEYLNREKSLELQIIGKSDAINNNYFKIANNNNLIKESEEAKKIGEFNQFYNVDIRELVDIKHETRKSLISARKELELKLEEIQLQFQIVMHKLTVFNHEYNDNHIVINGDEYRKLFEESHRLIEIKYNLKSQLDKIEEYLKITELTEEEGKTILKSMTDLEKTEYERRKTVNSTIATVENIIDEETVVKELEEDSNETIEDNIKTEEIVGKESEKTIENEVDDNYFEFIKNISRDVLSSVNKLRGVKVTDGKYLSVSAPNKETEELELEDTSVQIANGLYLNKRDVFKALNNYVRKNKGESFTVEGINETLTITRKSLRKVKKYLRECTIKKLFSEKKLSAFDIRRVFGKDESEKYIGKDTDKVKMPKGDYILRSDVQDAIGFLFVEKTPTWIEMLKSKFSKQNNKILATEAIDADYSLVDDEELETEYVKQNNQSLKL